jgi:ABC-type nitrate/sulfonate/bicarbonate transport system substrate-binding protein
MPGEIVDVLIVRKDYLSGNREKAGALLRGWFKALDHMGKKPADAFARMNARLRVGGGENPKEAFELLWLPSRRENIGILGAELEKNAGGLLRVMLEKRLIDKTVDVRALIDSGPLEGLE